jgi:hypothetical protein
MKTVITLLAAAALVFIATPRANATTYTYADNWVNWPGYTSSLGDENGTPKIDHMNVTINNGYLDKVSIVLHDSPHRQAFDSLFISTGGAWDSWDYFVHDGGAHHTNHTDGNVADDGLYQVKDDYTYTFVTDKNRVGNPNGIDANSLTFMDSTFGASHAGNSFTIDYDFADYKIDINPDEFFVAYSPWCCNDVIGGGTAPVPEPATMLLFGTGLAGLATIGRRKMKRD